MSLSSKIRPCRCREAQAPQEIADRLEPEMTLVHGDGGSWRAAADGTLRSLLAALDGPHLSLATCDDILRVESAGPVSGR